MRRRAREAYSLHLLGHTYKQIGSIVEKVAGNLNKPINVALVGVMVKKGKRINDFKLNHFSISHLARIQDPDEQGYAQ